MNRNISKYYNPFILYNIPKLLSEYKNFTRKRLFELYAKYKDIIRPFNVNKNVEFTDIWDFENVRAYKGKHPAEKPINLLKHAICSTTYENDVILDCFSGSGSTCISAIETNRKSISFEIDYNWYVQSIQRCHQKTSSC